MSSPNQARPNRRAYKSSPNPAQTGKSPTSPAWTLPKSQKLQTRAWPNPTSGLKNQARAQPGIFGSGRLGRAAHAQLYYKDTTWKSIKQTSNKLS
jgi:hypothetical protein